MVKAPRGDGRIDPGGQTLQALVTTANGGTFQPGLGPVAGVSAAPAHKPNTTYTDNPNEVVTRKTVPAPKDVVAMLRATWSELNEQGARTLTAQFLHETTAGQNCYNWNLGNVKEVNPNKPHMYLISVWEPLSAAGAAYEVAHGNGLVHVATAEDFKSHPGWVTPGKTVIVAQPPSPIARFKAYPSLPDGAAGWIGHHKKVAANFSDYLPTANAGNCANFARLLKRAKYYTGNEGAYAHSMISYKAQLDRTLGPVK